MTDFTSPPTSSEGPGSCFLLASPTPRPGLLEISAKGRPAAGTGGSCSAACVSFWFELGALRLLAGPGSHGGGHDRARVETGEHFEMASKAGTGMLRVLVNVGKLCNPRASGSHLSEGHGRHAGREGRARGEARTEVLS